MGNQEKLNIPKKVHINPCKCGNKKDFKAVILNSKTHPLKCFAWVECSNCKNNSKNKAITPRFGKLSKATHLDLIRN